MTRVPTPSRLLREQENASRNRLLVAKDGTEARPDFWFRGGATIIVDLRNGSVQHIVRQRIDNETRLAEQRRFVVGDDTALAMASMRADADDASPVFGNEAEPFAFIHEHFA